MPVINTHWVEGTKKYALKHSRLGNAIFKKFDKEYFMNHQLPDGPIEFRNSKGQSVNGSQLNKLFEQAVKQISAKKKPRGFKILKQRDFNWKLTSGLIILKSNDYPFVIKLFFENPKSFVCPFTKGFEQSIIFIMGEGINRFNVGFTRIKNLEVIKEKINSDPYWSKIIDFPRKWFWHPKNVKWFVVEGENIGPERRERIEFPSIYAIVSDEIVVDENFEMYSKKNREMVIRLSTFLGNRMDPHINNFLREKSTGKLVIIDSEHFPSMVGLQKPLEYNNYFEWYAKLSLKCIDDYFLKYKKRRHEDQFKAKKEYLPI
ncbi:hypothetical protein M1446_02330 [Candidatus Dependentiae bacterium]|nr:hypothetical protein [Candidatus Dependentiae bacterium]